EKNTKGKSLLKFKEKYSDDVKLRVRFSFDNLTLDDDLLNIPLFMADYSKKFIDIALKKLNK
ncbi:MAG: ATPase, partial [Fusobacterium perfoetens]|nr:ATPase [Fusobacterium perfoetens]